MTIGMIVLYFRVGYYDVSEEDTWRWVDCNATNSWHESLWGPDQPDNDGDCAVLDQYGDMYDESCDESRYFICEISPKGRMLYYGYFKNYTYLTVMIMIMMMPRAQVSNKTKVITL